MTDGRNRDVLCRASNDKAKNRRNQFALIADRWNTKEGVAYLRFPRESFAYGKVEHKEFVVFHGGGRFRGNEKDVVENGQEGNTIGGQRPYFYS